MRVESRPIADSDFYGQSINSTSLTSQIGTITAPNAKNYHPDESGAFAKRLRSLSPAKRLLQLQRCMQLTLCEKRQRLITTALIVMIPSIYTFTSANHYT